MDYKLKMLGHYFKVLWLCLTKLLNILWFALVAKVQFISSSGVLRAVCVYAKVRNQNCRTAKSKVI